MRNHNPKNPIMNLAENFVAQLRYNGDTDFSEWQKIAKETLTDLLGLQNMLQCESDFEIEKITDCGDYTDTRFSFQSEPDYYVPCHMLIPKNIGKKLPVMICLQGHSTGMHISLGNPIYECDEEDIKSGDRNYAQLAARKGYCAIALEQRYMGECGGTPEGPACSEKPRYKYFNDMPAILFGRTAIGERVHDVSKLIDLIEKNPDGVFDFADTENIFLTGNSGGGTTTFYTACVDERIKYAIPSCSVCTYKDSIINLYHCECNYIPSIARFFDMGDLAGLIAPRKLIIVAGKNDSIFPLEGVKETFNLAQDLFEKSGNKNNIRLIIGDGGHRYYAKEVFQMLEDMKKRLS